MWATFLDHEEREVHEGFGFSELFTFAFVVVVFFVIFVSSVVDTSTRKQTGNFLRRG